MKRMMIWTLAVLCVLAGCARGGTGKAGTTVAPTSTAPACEVTLLLPNAMLDGLQEETVTLLKAYEEVDAKDLVGALAENGAIPEGSEALTFQADGVHGVIDLSRAFGDGVATSGTAGETMMLASLVNTLSAFYELQDVLVTSEGKAIQTGHNIYDEPLAPFTFDTVESAENTVFTQLAPNADDGVRMLIVNEPTDVQKEKAPATETVFDEAEQDRVRIIPRSTDARLELWEITYEHNEFTKTNLVYERAVAGEGFVLGGSIARPEGVPQYVLVLSDSAYTLEYLFSYDGKDGVPNLELIQGARIR